MYVPEPTEATRDAVLEVAAQALWRRDEGSLRIADICQATNLSSSVIYNNFRSRQGLIDAAYLSIYESMTTEIVAIFAEVGPRLTTFTELRDYIAEQQTNPTQRDYWRRNRHMRLRIATAAIARPSLQGNFAVLQETYLRGLTAFFTDLQERHVVGDLLSAREMAFVFESSLLAHSFNDIALEPADDKGWVRMLLAVLGAYEPGAAASPPEAANPESPTS